jgi:ABC-type uncharacterized transport system involved in gliding motility auxiliary subunit
MTNRIFGIIGWLGTAFVLAAVAIWVVTQARLNTSAQWDQYRMYLAWAGLVCIVIYMASQWREVAEMFRRRQARYGTLAASSVLIVLAILVAVNYIGKRQNKRWDLTENKQFSLSDQSRNVVAKLDAPVEIMGFLPPADQPVTVNTFRDLLQEYAGLSSQIKLELIDADRNPSVAAQNEVRNYGEIIIRHKGRTERVTTAQEQDVTNALIKAVSGEARTVYFTQGHGEKDPTSSSEAGGYGAASESLKRENYTVEKLVLAQQGAVPDNATMVVVAGPRVDFLPGEVETLEKYLGKGGKLLLELDAPGPDESPLPNLVGLAKKWGIDVGTNLVLDQTGMGQLFGGAAETPVAANYPSHPITARLDVMTAFRIARSVTPVSGGNEGHTAQSIVETSPRSWAEADLKSLYDRKPPSPDEKAGDKTGPISIAAAVSAPVGEAKPEPEGEGSAPKPETRVVVFGDSDFASNMLFTSGGNRDLFMNTVGWLSQQENLISIRPKEPTDRRLNMNAAQQNIVTWFSLLAVPLAIFGAGIYGWWRRR